MARECECQAQQRQARRIAATMERAGVPRRYQGRLLDDVERDRFPAAWRRCREYVDEWEQARAEGRWLFISGPVGTGKTLLAYATVQELLARGVPAVCDTVPGLMDQLRPGRDGLGGERLRLVQEAELLFLDDVGAERSSDWVVETLFKILNHRYVQMLPTIMTSNAYLEELSGIRGWERIADRIVEMASPLVRLDGTSYRLEAARRAMAR